MSMHEKDWLGAGAGTLGLLALLASGGALGPAAAGLLGAGGTGTAGAAGAATADALAAGGADAAGAAGATDLAAAGGAGTAGAGATGAGLADAGTVAAGTGTLGPASIGGLSAGSSPSTASALQSMIAAHPATWSMLQAGGKGAASSLGAQAVAPKTNVTQAGPWAIQQTPQPPQQQGFQMPSYEQQLKSLGFA